MADIDPLVARGSVRDTRTERLAAEAPVRVNPLRAHARDAEEARRLAARLHGQMLPDVTLATSDSMRLPLLAHVRGTVVLYFVTGREDRTWVDGRPTPDASQHRGYVNHADALGRLGARTLGVSCQSLETLRGAKHFLEATHLIFSDPQLLLSQALDLPTTSDGDIGRYRRLALVAIDGCILRAFGPLSDREAAGNARQVMTWMNFQGG